MSMLCFNSAGEEITLRTNADVIKQLRGMAADLHRAVRTMSHSGSTATSNLFTGMAQGASQAADMLESLNQDNLETED